MKSIFASKTFWTNTVALLISAGGYATGVVPNEWQPVLAGGLAALNIILRKLTTEPVTITGAK